MIIGRWIQQFDQWLSRLTTGVSFHGGVHPAQHKLISTHQPIQTPPLADKLIISLTQHVGPASIPLVEVGQRVLGGELIARCAPPLGVPLHAPTSGMIVDIGDYPTSHPSGLPGPCIVLQPDGLHELKAFQPKDRPNSVQSLKAILLHAGIIGMGGAGFPSFRKIANKARQIHTLIVNAAECEPYITCDDMLMRERPHEIIEGALITAHALGAKKVIIGIEDNKPEAALAMRQYRPMPESDTHIQVEVTVVPTIYPMGSANQLITQLTGNEIPSDAHSTDLGLVMFNVATLAAVYRAVVIGKPVMSRVVTVTGFAIDKPCNVEVPIGTPFEHLVNWAGLQTPHAPWLMGGPMMGTPIHHPQTPVIKTSNCILVNLPEPESETLPCIRCGACMDACPINLLPQQLYWHAKAEALDKLEALHLKDCIECGCCAYVCPSQIPLVQYYRHAKVAVKKDKAEKEAQQRAKQRHEAQLARKEQEAREKAERLAAKRAAMMAAEQAEKAADEAPKELT
ncbi:MAG: electron transport complex subunit RsxC [Gammaproteobacteria bacterium]|nr:electron transport complex subunit RsxC [Gammaproteobacteria bacterium]OYZ06493.1 MAG: electron transport complex subunit RsxC [Thiotrichales bacterium 16-46-22]OZA97645.1 MAG: electron transport complex subunit RsxC [Thiotrichales bacterium 34-46-19]UCG18204.1 MAG: electron transport complex subunit RsxC [Thiotrichales bacterium]MCL5796779.1 electron transport complex subunit RsxC [Gammaproteobacteria bacterium]